LVLAGTAQTALAQNGFAIQGNQLTITGGNTGAAFAQSATFGADGVVSHVTNVPSTNGIGVPSFAFTLVNHGLAAGDYEFTVGVIFDRDGNNSRIEARLPRLLLRVAANGTVTSSLPSTGNDLKVRGRDSSGAIQISILFPGVSSGGPISLSNGTITFDANDLVTRIQNSHASFNSLILQEFDQTAAYTYRIVVDQTAGTPVQFSRVVTATPATYASLPRVQTTCSVSPCTAANSAFVLNSSEFATFFGDAYSVTGSFNVVPFVAPSPTPTPTQTPSPTPSATPTATPTPATGGGGGGGSASPSPSPAATPALPTGFQDGLNTLTGLLNQLTFSSTTPPNASQLSVLEQALGNADTQLDSALTQLQNGTLTLAGGFSLLQTSGQTFDKGGVAAGTGATINLNSAANTLDGFADVIGAMVTKGGLTSTQISDIATFTETKFQSASQMLTSSSSRADVEKMMDSTAELLNKTLDAGATLSPALVTAAVQISLKAVSSIAGDVVSKLGLGAGFNVNDAAAVQNLLRREPVALTESLSSAVAIRSRQPVDAGAARTSLGDSGINAATADRIVAALGAITNPDGVQVGGTTATSRLLTALARAFGGGSVAAALEAGLNALSATDFTVAVDAVTGAMLVRTGTEAFAASSTAVRLVPASIPEGVNYLADGRAVAVADGVAIELAPAAADMLGFAAAAEKAGFPATFRSNGTVSLALAGNQRFSGTFAFDNIGNASGKCGAISFTNPTGAVNANGYAFTMACANGIRQRLLPFVDNDGFYSAVANAGLRVSTDRNTGIVTIGTVGRFKPSFFVNAIGTADQTYLRQNGVNGFAFRPKEVNGDGRLDYEVISATGVQVLYSAP
jgi:hypothetical protein